jgi:hypothetical protein
MSLFSRTLMMPIRLFSTTVAMSAFSLGALAGDLLPQSDEGTKVDAKEAGRSAQQAVKKTGRAAKKATKKVVHLTAKKTRQAA